MGTSIYSSMSFTKALDYIGTQVGRDITLRQLHTLAVIVSAGPVGIDVTKVGEATQSSAAAVSRNVRVLGTHHYDRSKGEGMGLISIELDPLDNRRRLAKPTDKGVELLKKVLSMLN